MGGFTAKLDLPTFIPREEILGKQVFDSEIVCIGSVKDWTYSSDGIIKMVVKRDDDAKKASLLIPFSYIDRVGEFIMLKIKRYEFEELKEESKKEELKSFDKIDHKKLDELVKVKGQKEK